MSATCETCRWWDGVPPKPRARKPTVGRCLFVIEMPVFPIVVRQGHGFRWPPSKWAAWNDQADCPTHQPKDPTP